IDPGVGTTDTVASPPQAIAHSPPSVGISRARRWPLSRLFSSLLVAGGRMVLRASLRVLHMLVMLPLPLVAFARPAPPRGDTLDEYSSDFLDLFTPGTILAEGDYGFVIVDTKTGRIVPVEGGTPGPLTLLGDGREVAQLIWWKGDNAVVDISRG